MPSAISRIALIARGALACALLSCLPAGAVHAAQPQPPAVPAANPEAPVPPTRYQLDAAYQPRPAEPATPDQAWKEQNRIVAAGAGHDHAAHGHAAHAGHAPPAAADDPHAGHAMPAAPDPHAGHAMPAAADAHAGHQTHQTQQAAPAAHQHEGHH